MKKATIHYRTLKGKMKTRLIADSIGHAEQIFKKKFGNEFITEIELEEVTPIKK